MELIHGIQQQILNFYGLFLKNLLNVLIWSKQFLAQNRVTNQSSKLKLRKVTLIFLAFVLKTVLIRLKQTTNFLKKIRICKFEIWFWIQWTRYLSSKHNWMKIRMLIRIRFQHIVKHFFCCHSDKKRVYRFMSSDLATIFTSFFLILF